MAEEPSAWELSRRIDEIRDNCRANVGTPAYLADQRRIDERIKDMASLLLDSKTAAALALAAEEKTRAENDIARGVDLEKLRQTIRWVFGVVVIPLLIASVGLLVTLLRR